MLYDNGYHGGPRPSPQAQPPYAMPAQQANQFYQPTGRRQGSYADYYNGLTGGRASQGARMPYYGLDSIWMRHRQRMQRGNAAYGSPPRPPQSFAPRPSYTSGALSQSMQQGGPLGYSQQPYTPYQFDINGRPPGAWDYTAPQQQAYYPMVTR